MVALSNRAEHYIFSLWFLSIFLFSSPNLSGRTLNDVYHTSTHGMAVGLKCAARGSLKIQNANKSPKIATWVSSHKFFGLYLRNQGTYRQSEKMLSSNMSSRCPRNMVNFGPLTVEIGSVREFGAPQLISTGFASWQRYCTAVK